MLLQLALKVRHRHAQFLADSSEPIPNESHCAARKNDSGVLTLRKTGPRASRQIAMVLGQRRLHVGLAALSVHTRVRSDRHAAEHHESTNAPEEREIVELRVVEDLCEKRHCERGGGRMRGVEVQLGR
jgi:hypothetical protein